MNTQLLTNAQIVTPSAHFTGSIEIDNGVIAAIHKDKFYRDGHDLKGAWLIPGCIDIHTDYLEKELHPRSSASFPMPFALHFLDARAASCGITTVFSAISFSDNESKGRNFEQAICMARQFDEVRGSLLLRHFLHARIDPNTHALLDHLSDMALLESLYMVIFNENIPGERQYSLNQQIEMRMKEHGTSWEVTRDKLLAQIQEAREINHRHLIYEAFKDKCVIGSHDDTTVAHILEAHASGSVLAEMPTTLAAARKAKELGMWVCMGAPNYYRGGSHCGNLACVDAMEEDLVDILCSDYHFPTMLGSVVRMIDEGMSPSKAVNMVTLNPARLLRFDEEIGSIAVGLKADLVAFQSERSFASVTSVWVEGVCKMAADYTEKARPLTGAINTIESHTL
ncbi:alpha-D-ribose 1-methylphosphonate 5-triphosphate diphosphatase [Dinghuibacter silviterrae]|uniref:Alpha-D-ribose 1-methylphosphonate 5-triphosphate diphosphatase n=1 Tax=Dinghuibacter silviterrae TaxID=1539049 RepID=A0A4R8DTS8_9BACT|nr:alpha-D-ribose 1-methylphosphonate 5-triphosphate diphosphatase [Dinghuibacter silviterrae]TDX00845.1 alpha-D-ribose 1-methylphosphonate 5-triphosphate diphosphatase [Dinghuibacter silviterrae]